MVSVCPFVWCFQVCMTLSLNVSIDLGGEYWKLLIFGRSSVSTISTLSGKMRLLNERISKYRRRCEPG